MADIGFDDSSSDRLEGSHVHSVVGGLILKGNSRKTTQSPKESVLGLQKLAEEKRKRKLEEEGEKTKKVRALSSNRDTDSWEESDPRDVELQGKARLSTGNKDFKSKSRHYRTGLVETPSHTGGVDEETREKQLMRLERDRETRRGGVYAQSRMRDKEKDSRKDREGYRDRKDDDRDKRRYDKGERSSRRSRDYNRDNKDSYFKEAGSSRGEWEETPSRSSRSSRDEGYTPRHKPKGNFISNVANYIHTIMHLTSVPDKEGG